MSHTGVVATTPILSASPGPATTNTYMRFSLRSLAISAQSLREA